MEVKVYEYTLPNQSKVIHVRIPYLRSVGVGVGTNFGAIHEPRGKEGSAHLLEHLKMRRGKKYSAYPYHPLKFLERGITPYLNGQTSYETTLYQLKLLKEDSEIGFDVLSDVYQNHEFRKEDFEREKKTVKKEIGEEENIPFFLFLQNLWGDTRLGVPTLGTFKSLKNIELGDLIELSIKHYVGRKTVVVVVGNLKEGEVRKLAEKYFDGLSEGTKTSEDNVYINLQQRGKFVERITTKNTYASIITGRKFGKFNSNEFIAIAIILCLIKKKVWREMREVGEIYSFGIERVGGKNFSFGWITLHSKLNKARRLLKKLRKCVESVPLTEDKIQETKKIIKRIDVMEMEEDPAWGIVNSVIEWYFRTERWKDIVFNYPQLLTKTSVEDVREVYEKYFDVDEWVTVIAT